MEDRVKVSSEILRITLPHMAKYQVPVTPKNYTVWYEYSSGKNASLKSDLDKLMSAESADLINEDVTKDLFVEYFDPTKVMEKVQVAQTTLTTLTESMGKILNGASGEMDKYQSSLDGCQEKLSGSINDQDLQALVFELGKATSAISKSNGELIGDLAETEREAQKLREELVKARTEAKTDALTGLYNRKAFYEKIETLSNQGSMMDNGHCLIMADIDHFKNTNDTYGHLMGDKVIKAVASVMKDNIKGKDMAVRFGGEEFLIFLPDTDVAGAHVVAESIRKTMEVGRIVRPTTGEKIGGMTISLGVTSINKDETAEAAINRADEALYAAKENGRNRVEIKLEN